MKISTTNYDFKSIPLDLSGLSFDIADGSFSEIKELFFVEGKYAPIIRWCSFPQKDWPVPTQVICDYWRTHQSIEAFNLSHFDTDDKLKILKPYTAILSKDGEDYTYDFIGDKFAQFHHLTQSNTATLMAMLNHTNTSIDLLNYVIMGAAAIRDQAAVCLYQSGTDTNMELWNKIILPLKSTVSDQQKFIVFALKSP